MSSEDKPWAPPLLRWAGSKRKLLPILMAQFPQTIDRYIEPFVGSACLFFALHPKSAVLGDINKELLQTYSTIKSHPRLVARQVSSWDNSKEQYYELRDLNVDLLSEIDQAARHQHLHVPDGFVLSKYY